jgi:hypothetical protein
MLAGLNWFKFAENVQCLLIFFVMQSRTTTVIHSYLKTLVFISYYNSRCSLLSLCIYFLVFSLHPMPYRPTIPSFLNVSVQCVANQQLALSRLMHSIHCCSAAFIFQALETRPAQETSTVCAGLHNKEIRRHWKFTLYILLLFLESQSRQRSTNKLHVSQLTCRAEWALRILLHRRRYPVFVFYLRSSPIIISWLMYAHVLKNIDWGCLRTDCGGEYLDLRGMK